jgi:hypothetical protein
VRGKCKNRHVIEATLDLQTIVCPRCAGQLVVRVAIGEREGAVALNVDTACIACGVSPWEQSDARQLVFTPGVPEAGDAEGKLAAARARIDTLHRRMQTLEASATAAQRDAERAEDRNDDSLRGEISRLEGQLAEARAEVRKAEEATRGEVSDGKRPIEIE